MKIIPITDFENEYAITDEGKVLDLYDNSEKVSYLIKSFKLNQPAVDLYKNGEFIITVTLKELVIKHFFNANVTNFKEIRFIDGNKDNLSPYNMETHGVPSTYVNKKLGLIKPPQIYRYNENGKYLVNQEEMDQYDELCRLRSLELSKIRKKEYKVKNRKIPLHGTPEREVWEEKRKLKQIEKAIKTSIETRFKNYSEYCSTYNQPFDLTEEDIHEQYDRQNGICVISEEKLDLAKPFKILTQNTDLGFVKGNIELGMYGPSIRLLISKVRNMKKVNKEKTVGIRVTWEQHEKLKAMAKESKKPLTTVILSKVFPNS